MGDGVIMVDDALLRSWPLPVADPEGDKEERGRVLVVAGSREMPGAAWLAATAALRAGAGKLVVATAASVASALAIALPESRVIALPESDDGCMSADGAALLGPTLGRIDAMLLGPGWIEGSQSLDFIRHVMTICSAKTAVVLDAAAMEGVLDGNSSRRCLITPHAGEMAHLLHVKKEAVLAMPKEHAIDAARRWGCVVALKGARTWIVTPTGDAWLHSADEPGLGTSGSGDVLAGVIAGLAARGASLEQAAAWGVALHSRAGGALKAKFGVLGYLAGELPYEIPALSQALLP